MRVALVLLAATLLWPLGGRAYRETARGNAAYLEGDNDEALRRYTRAQVAAPEAPELHYDIGNVLYRQGDFDGAVEEYRQALAGAEGALRQHAAYNLGNAHFRAGRYAEALEAYRQALELDPTDRDAKRNYELALRQLERHAQPPAPSQPQPDGEQDEGGESSSRSRPAPPEPSEGAEPEGARPETPEKDRPSPAPQPAPRRLTRDEAERLLDQVAQEEREQLQRLLRRRATPARRGGKDW